jgi:signal transduction histidine kinase/CheY-like chemotaxis protein
MNTVPADEIREQLSRLVSSAAFVRSKRLVRFLRFTIECRLKNEESKLTEHMIGTEVYDRPTNFDPFVDGIVRAEAHRLRAKLNQYYRGPGRHDPVLIVYPTGSYVPVFHYQAHSFLPKSGLVASIIRERDWSHTSLDILDSWPQALKDALNTHLRSAFPAAVLWGQEQRFFFNDAFYELLGEKYRDALGAPFSPGLDSVMPAVGRKAARAMAESETLSLAHDLWMVERADFREEHYFDVSLSPLVEWDGDCSGVLLVANEATRSVLRERRARVLAEVFAGAANATSPSHACRLAASNLRANPQDVPFASLYLFDRPGPIARLRATAGVREGLNVSPMELSLAPGDSSPLAEAANSGTPQVLRVANGFGPLPLSVWNAPAREIVVMPLSDPSQAETLGFMIAGVNPYRTLDQDYTDFFQNLASRIAFVTSFTRVKERAQREAEAAAERDRDRSNALIGAARSVRSPFTVMLGTLASMIDDPHLSFETRTQLIALQRSVINTVGPLETLVDLLDVFAERSSLVYEPVNLSAITARLARAFRSSVEEKGLRFVVDCLPTTEAAYVDRTKWEKMVFLLLEGVRKAATHGEIGVALVPVGSWIELSVWTTEAQISIPRASSDEDRRGGWSNPEFLLARHFASLHGGNIRLDSERATGSRFTVSIPRGQSHLATDTVAKQDEANAVTSSLSAFLHRPIELEDEEKVVAASAEEPSRWHRHQLVPSSSRRILVSIEDAGLRDYCSQLLGPIYHLKFAERSEVSTLLDQDSYDMILADTSIGIWKMLRDVQISPQSASVPVMLLSDNGSDEERLHAYSMGTNDFLVMPFTPRDLLVRVQAQIMAGSLRNRSTSERRTGETGDRWQVLSAIADRLPMAVVVADVATGQLVVKNDRVYEMLGEEMRSIGHLSDIYDGLAFHPDGTPVTRDECPLIRAARFGEAVANEPLIYSRPGGQRLSALANSYPITDSDGRRVAAVVTISERGEANLTAGQASA